MLPSGMTPAHLRMLKTEGREESSGEMPRVQGDRSRRRTLLLVLRRQHGRKCGRSSSDREHRPAAQSRAAAAAKTCTGIRAEILAARFGCAPFAEHFAPRFFFQQPV